MEISTGAWDLQTGARVRGGIGILFRSAETTASVPGSARIPFDWLEFRARLVGRANLGIPRAGQVVFVTRSLLKRRSYS
jgi:hypothetical protein